MCEYCGCQAVATIAELTAEHDHVVELIGVARQAHLAGDVEAVAVVARRISAVLGPHSAVEEEGLFPALAGEFGEHVSHLVAEHRYVERVLGEARSRTPSDPGWPGRFFEAMEVLRDHILAEQDGAFPAALSVLEAADWEAAEAVRAAVGSAMPGKGVGIETVS